MPKKTAQNGLTKTEGKPAKKKRDWVPNPQKDFGQENVEPGDNARYLRHALASWDLPPIDISDPKQVEMRIKQYFRDCLDNDMKPNVVGLADWIGVDQTTLTRWKRGDFRAETHCPLIKRAYMKLEELWVDYMQNGKINPPSGIFLGKNMFGYKDVQDMVITPNNPLGEEVDPEVLRKRIEDNIVIDDYEVDDG